MHAKTASLSTLPLHHSFHPYTTLSPIQLILHHHHVWSQQQTCSVPYTNVLEPEHSTMTHVSCQKKGEHEKTTFFLHSHSTIHFSICPQSYPNKNNAISIRTLSVMKQKLKGAQTGHSLLKRKSEALTKRFRDIVRKIDDVCCASYFPSTLECCS